MFLEVIMKLRSIGFIAVFFGIYSPSIFASERGASDNLSHLDSFYSGRQSNYSDHQNFSYQNYSYKNVMLFVGPGTWGEDISSLENTLSSHGVSYTEVGSEELESMSLGEISKFGLII